MLVPNAIASFYIISGQIYSDSIIRTQTVGMVIVYSVSTFTSFLGLVGSIKRSAFLLRVFSLYMWAYVVAVIGLNIWSIVELIAHQDEFITACQSKLQPATDAICSDAFHKSLIISVVIVGVVSLFFSYFANAVFHQASALRLREKARANTKFSYISQRGGTSEQEKSSSATGSSIEKPSPAAFV